MKRLKDKHRRKGPKSTRGGCLMCKPWKMEGSKRSDRLPFRDRRRNACCRGDVQ